MKRKFFRIRCRQPEPSSPPPVLSVSGNWRNGEKKMKTIAASAFVLAMSFTAASAQTAVEAATGADVIISGPGILMGNIPAAPLKFVNVQNTDLLSSKLIGTEVYNRQNDVIGKISDVVIGDGKTVIGFVASVGGFLGVGTSYVVHDPASIALAKVDNAWRAYVDTTRDDLSNAPKLDYDLMAK